ncbi:MAG: hypothetical protein HKN87_11385 [Saprospiraceae bacterium]|nr:hypothetical protein [Saprospiraceae bacterium]
MIRLISVSILVSILSLTHLSAQYFGKNKPRYTNFDFKVAESPHFQVYHYLKNKDELTKLMQWSELWYDLHSDLLRDTFHRKNPLVFYNNHADFQQTSTISGQIGVSTGGVTEGLKNRVVMPVAMSNQQTFHVLGHEMVHAFQFNMLLSGDSTGLQSLRNLPLWIVEGMAEYMSLGRTDAHTAMWMRNAVVSENIPSLRDLSRDPRYFPYRYGQAFWSFLTGIYGDEVIKPLFIATAKFGIENAVPMVLGIPLEDLSEAWVKTLKDHYEPMFKGKKKRGEGRKFLSDENSGKLNIAPAISPNGRYVVFLSEKSIFTTDLFLADLRTGKILRKVASTTKKGNIDHLHFLESAGTWSSNSRQFAYVIFKKGRNYLVITEVESGKEVEVFPLKDVPAFSNPTWSPDGRTIIVNGLVNGQPDLFAVNLRTKSTRQLTNDDFAEIQPTFAYDGDRIAFATDRVSMKEGRTDGKWKYNLAVMDLASREIENLDVFRGADNMNPVWDENDHLYFLSDRDGFRNIYRYHPDSSHITQLTDLITGVSGITKYSPAISINKRGNTLLYTHFLGDSYNVQRAAPTRMEQIVVATDDVDMSAAILPPGNLGQSDRVNPALANLDDTRTIDKKEIVPVKYRPNFKLDYIGGGAGVGVGTSNTFGTNTGLAGGVDMLFSDVLGYNQIFSSLAMNGEIYDFGGQVRYVNTRKKIGYGFGLQHIPIRYSYYQDRRQDQLETNSGTFDVFNYPYTTVRYFIDGASALAQYTFSRTLRLESNLAFTRYSSRVDQYNNYYTILQSGNDLFPGNYIGQDRERQPSIPGFNLYSTGLALVGDNSNFGLTSALQGYRYRIGADHYVGDFSYSTILVDLRKYFWFDKFNVSFRALHYGRYGNDANVRTLGFLYSIDPTLVRGYSSGALGRTNDVQGLTLEQLEGSKLLVGNAEIRLPFTGPERLSLIKSGLLITELAAFFDFGMAWKDNDQFGEGGTLEPQPVMSTGISCRINLFGAMILEPYYAKPLREGAGWNFGLNFVPGW